MEKGKIIQESIWNAVYLFRFVVKYCLIQAGDHEEKCNMHEHMLTGLLNRNTAGFTCVLLYICDMSVCLGCVLYIALTFQCISTFGCMKCSDSVMSCAERSGRGFRVSLPSGEITYLHTGSGREELPRFLQAVCRSTGGHP